MKLYRFTNNSSDSNNIIGTHVFDNAYVYLHEYETTKETPCGAWIVIKHDKKRFVNLSCYKKYACKDVEQAKEEFLGRKKMQIRILSSQLQNAEDSMRAMVGEMQTGPHYPEDY